MRPGPALAVGAEEVPEEVDAVGDVAGPGPGVVAEYEGEFGGEAAGLPSHL